MPIRSKLTNITAFVVVSLQQVPLDASSSKSLIHNHNHHHVAIKELGHLLTRFLFQVTYTSS
jgi:hypothetical protein